MLNGLTPTTLTVTSDVSGAHEPGRGTQPASHSESSHARRNASGSDLGLPVAVGDAVRGQHFYCSGGSNADTANSATSADNADSAASATSGDTAWFDALGCMDGTAAVLALLHFAAGGGIEEARVALGVR